MRLLTSLCVVLFLAVAPPAPAQAPSRDAALAALKSADAGQREHAAEQLAKIGRMADVPALLAALRDSDEDVRTVAEEAIWVIWSRSGDAQVDKLFAQALGAMNEGRYPESIATFSQVIERKPDFAEGWNKRATLYFLTGQFENSLKDCDEVIKRNPTHFGALAGYGQIYLQLHDFEKALYYFKRALAVNPNMDGVALQIQILERVLETPGKNKA